jgi:hypothetical protein
MPSSKAQVKRSYILLLKEWSARVIGKGAELLNKISEFFFNTKSILVIDLKHYLISVPRLGVSVYVTCPTALSFFHSAWAGHPPS